MTRVSRLLKYRLTFSLLAIGLLGCLLHWANLFYVFHYGTRTGTDYTLGPDAPVYLGMTESLARGERLDPMYQERLLLPCILLILRFVGFSHTVFPWIVSLLLVPTVVAVGWLAWLLTQRVTAAYIAGVLTTLYPTAYQYGILVETDTLHLYLAVLAVVGTVAASRSQNNTWFLGTGVLWFLTHLARPALWGMGLVLPLFFWKALKTQGTRWAAVLACCGALAVPVGFAVSNIVRFGIASPSLHTAEILFVWTRSRVHAVVETESKGGEWTPLVRDAVADARTDPRWRILHGQYATPREFKDAYRSVIRDSLKYLRQHMRVFVKTTMGEFLYQCTVPFRVYHQYQAPSLESLYPPMERFWRVVLKLGWWFLGCGWAWVCGGRNRDIAILILVVALLNFVPSSLSCWAGARIRMPTDVLGISFVAAALMQPVAWGGLIVLGLLAYVPRRFFGASHAYFSVVSGAVALGWLVVMWRMGGEKIDAQDEARVP